MVNRKINKADEKNSELVFANMLVLQHCESQCDQLRNKTRIEILSREMPLGAGIPSGAWKFKT